MIDPNRLLTLEQLKPFIFGLLLCFMFGCAQTNAQSTAVISAITPALSLSPTPVKLPDSLTEVWPLPDSSNRISEYTQAINNAVHGGIGFRVRVDRIYSYFWGEGYEEQNPTNINTDVLLEHVELYVDGEKVSQELLRAYALDSIIIRDNTGKLLYSGIAQMDLSWSVLLTQGEHIVLLTIYNVDKIRILEYTWNFKVIND